MDGGAVGSTGVLAVYERLNLPGYRVPAPGKVHESVGGGISGSPIDVSVVSVAKGAGVRVDGERSGSLVVRRDGVIGERSAGGRVGGIA
ncbi:hypothetical protein GCM10020220_023130 [Nonomuraea rubra]